MAAIDKSAVKHAARLARMRLDEKELEFFSKQLSAIVDYIDKLKELDVEGVDPTSHVLPMKNVSREDKVRPSLEAGEALKNAPQREGDFFKVPQVIG